MMKYEVKKECILVHMFVQHSTIEPLYQNVPQQQQQQYQQ